jgi:hypothetical protein
MKAMCFEQADITGSKKLVNWRSPFCLVGQRDGHLWRYPTQPESSGIAVVL